MSMTTGAARQDVADGTNVYRHPFVDLGVSCVEVRATWLGEHSVRPAGDNVDGTRKRVLINRCTSLLLSLVVHRVRKSLALPFCSGNPIEGLSRRWVRKADLQE